MGQLQVTYYILIGVPKGEGEREENIFDVIMVEKISNLMEIINPQIQET